MEHLLIWNSYVLVIRIKHRLIPSLCIGENHRTVLEYKMIHKRAIYTSNYTIFNIV